jgi:hypothetical protein
LTRIANQNTKNALQLATEAVERPQMLGKQTPNKQLGE